MSLSMKHPIHCNTSHKDIVRLWHSIRESHINMRRSYIQPSSDLKKIEEKNTINLREKMRNSSTSLSSYDHNEVKKVEDSFETNKKLERKTTEDINASADAFIKNFRKQLVIQRLQSIENYEKMLARGL